MDRVDQRVVIQMHPRGNLEVLVCNTAGDGLSLARLL
jgi:hypothetical protein